MIQQNIKPKTIAAGQSERSLVKAWVQNLQKIFFRIKHAKMVIVQVNIA